VTVGWWIGFAIGAVIALVVIAIIELLKEK